MKSPNFRTRYLNTLRPTAVKSAVEEAAKKALLNINNSDSCYRRQHGGRFEGLLEARDRVLDHAFSFEFDPSAKGMLKEGGRPP